MRSKSLHLTLAAFFAAIFLAAIASAQASGAGGGDRMGNAQAGGAYDPRGAGPGSGVKKVGRRGFEKVATLRLEQEGGVMELHVIPRSFSERISKIEIDGQRAEFNTATKRWTVTRAKPKKKPKISLLVGDQSANCKVQHFPHMGDLAVQVLQKGGDLGPVNCPGSDWADSL